MKTITPKKCKDEKAIVVCEQFIGEREVELNPKRMAEFEEPETGPQKRR